MIFRPRYSLPQTVKRTVKTSDFWTAKINHGCHINDDGLSLAGLAARQRGIRPVCPARLAQCRDDGMGLLERGRGFSPLLAGPVLAFVDDTRWFCQAGPQRCCEILA